MSDEFVTLLYRLLLSEVAGKPSMHELIEQLKEALRIGYDSIRK